MGMTLHSSRRKLRVLCFVDATTRRVTEYAIVTGETNERHYPRCRDVRKCGNAQTEIKETARVTKQTMKKE
jgi:hypothetical protein